MRGQWKRFGLAAVLVQAIAACATGDANDPKNTSSTDNTEWGGAGGTSSGVAGSGGSAGAGGGGQGGAVSSSSSGSGGMANLCGNGVKDPGEQCDGDDFGGKTCADIGLGSGSLLCNAFCGVVASNCLPKESCNDFQDNDLDGDTDCADSDCSNQPVCLDSCFSPKNLFVPGSSDGDTTGRPDTTAASCSAFSGPEMIFRLDPSDSGSMTVTLNSWAGTDFSLSLRTACGDVSSEFACVNDIGPNDFGDEVLHAEVVAGQTYYLVVDGATGGAGPFFVYIDIPQPEQWCGDFFDDDADGYLDCDDPTACQGTFECMPGVVAVGQQCFFNGDCMANANDPVCLTSSQGFPDGYCSEWCDTAVNDCPGDGICANIGLPSVHGVCLDGCVADADCRLGYACVDKGYATKVCMLGPEADCSNYVDDDMDSLMDCEDPDCQGTMACTGGAKAAGQPCTAHAECYSVGGDPLCLSELEYGYPGGYCSEYCYFMNDCGPGSICTTWFSFPSGAGTCMRTCMTGAQCGPGYACLDVGYPEKICVK